MYRAGTCSTLVITLCPEMAAGHVLENLGDGWRSSSLVSLAITYTMPTFRANAGSSMTFM